MDKKTTIVNLMVLGQLDKGKKINAKGKRFVLDEFNQFQGLYRLFRREDRSTTLDKIELLVKEVGDIVKELIANKDNNDSTKNDLITCDKMRDYIEQGLNGIEKLKETYIDDKTTWAILAFEMEKLEKLKNSIPLTSVQVPVIPTHQSTVHFKEEEQYPYLNTKVYKEHEQEHEQFFNLQQTKGSKTQSSKDFSVKLKTNNNNYEDEEEEEETEEVDEVEDEIDEGF